MIGNIKDLEKLIVNHPSAANASMKVLVSPSDGFEGYVLRVVEVEEGGYTPKHNHPWPHINYFIEGTGELMIDGKINPVEAGSFAFVPNNALHQFRNTGTTIFKFICIVPEEGHIV